MRSIMYSTSIVKRPTIRSNAAIRVAFDYHLRVARQKGTVELFQAQPHF